MSEPPRRPTDWAVHVLLAIALVQVLVYTLGDADTIERLRQLAAVALEASALWR